MAEAVVARLKTVVYSHPLIEHKAFAPPAALGRIHALQIAQDAALQMVHPLKPLLNQMGRGLLAADAAGAEESQGPGTALLHQGTQFTLHPDGEIAEGGRIRIEGSFETPHGHLVGVAGVDHQGVGVGDQGVPVLGGHIGSHRSSGIDLRPTDRHDLPLNPHLEPMESLFIRAVVLHLKRGQAGIRLLQQLQQCLHPGLRTAHGAIHPLAGQQHGALHISGMANRQEALPQRRQNRLGQRREAIEGGNPQTHRTRAGSASTCTPAAASSSRSASTAGLPVVSRVSP